MEAARSVEVPHTRDGRLYHIKSKIKNCQSIIINLPDGMPMVHFQFTKGEWKLFSLQCEAVVVFLR